MAKFTVTYRIVLAATRTVEADSEEQAEELANKDLPGSNTDKEWGSHFMTAVVEDVETTSVSPFEESDVPEAPKTDPTVEPKTPGESTSLAAGLIACELDTLFSRAEEIVEEIVEEIRSENRGEICDHDLESVKPEDVFDHPEVRKVMVNHVKDTLYHITYMIDRG
jgi:hypothetical protein